MKNTTALKAIRAHCLWCMGNSSNEVHNCNAQDLCPAWILRHGKAVKGISPLKTARRICLECKADSPKAVKGCDGQTYLGNCPLHPYRFGMNPKTYASKKAKESGENASNLAS